MKSGTVLGNIYGGGVGGVLGANPWDPRVPFATMAADNAANAIQNGVQYGGMPENSPWAKVTLHNRNADGTYSTEEMDLSQSSTTINISGGTIGGGGYGTLTSDQIMGNIYGGGDGEVPEMAAAIALQGVGSVFGTSNINITGGTILGSVYGGSKGSSKYFNQKNSYGQTITHIAEMNGTVNMRITGTDEKWPTIGGDIYGAGAGVESVGNQEYLRIATTGDEPLGQQYKTDINILIDLPVAHPFEHDIYGGGQMGLVDGFTNVLIKGGVVNGNVFGAGKGEEGHPSKAKVSGNTTVEISNSAVLPATSQSITIGGSVYGGGSAAQVEGNPNVIIHGEGEPVEMLGNVYGGGLGTTATVTGNTSVVVTGYSEVGNSVYGGWQWWRGDRKDLCADWRMRLVRVT